VVPLLADHEIYDYTNRQTAQHGDKNHGPRSPAPKKTTQQIKKDLMRPINQSFEKLYTATTG